MKLVILAQFLSFVLCLSAAARPAGARTSSARSEISGSDFILEPYIGYESGYLTQTGIPEIKSSGVNFGSRVGYKVLGVGIGIDYMIGSEDSEQSGIKSDYKPLDYGLFFGFKSWAGINIYGSYFLSSKAKLQSSDNSSDFEGTGLKFGMGWRWLSFIEFNLEAILRTYTKYGSAKLPNAIEGSTAGVSVSIPLI